MDHPPHKVREVITMTPAYMSHTLQQINSLLGKHAQPSSEAVYKAGHLTSITGTHLPPNSKPFLRTHTSNMSIAVRHRIAHNSMFIYCVKHSHTVKRPPCIFLALCHNSMTINICMHTQLDTIARARITQDRITTYTINNTHKISITPQVKVEANTHSKYQG